MVQSSDPLQDSLHVYRGISMLMDTSARDARSNPTILGPVILEAHFTKG